MQESSYIDSLTSADQDIPDWFIPLLGEAETAVRLGIKSWWGVAQVTPFWAYCFFLTAVL